MGYRNFSLNSIPGSVSVGLKLEDGHWVGDFATTIEVPVGYREGLYELTASLATPLEANDESAGFCAQTTAV